ncbi:MAG: hypothetical protein ACO2PM_07115 [Pyrobaculum sp.]|jgi:hypothetical protein
MKDVCRHIKEWIDGYRGELYLAIALDKILNLMNSYLEDAGEEGSKITKEDVEMCLKNDSTAKIIAVKDGSEVLWLWDGPLLPDMISKIAEMADRWGEAAAAAI